MHARTVWIPEYNHYHLSPSLRGKYILKQSSHVAGKNCPASRLCSWFCYFIRLVSGENDHWSRRERGKENGTLTGGFFIWTDAVADVSLSSSLWTLTTVQLGGFNLVNQREPSRPLLSLSLVDSSYHSRHSPPPGVSTRIIGG